MVTAFEVLHFLGPGTGDIYPDFEVEGVAPLYRAKPHEMTFRKGIGETKSELVLSKFDFAKAAWKFFPPTNPKITIHESVKIAGEQWLQLGLGKDARQSRMIPPNIGNIGFGYTKGIRFPHYGGVTIEKDVEIGSFTAIDRGVFDDTFIGEGTKIDNLVHVAHNVKIGKRCLIVAGTVLGGSCEIGDDCFIGMGALIRDHVKIGNKVTIGMGSVVVGDVGDGLRVMGNPARVK